MGPLDDGAQRAVAAVGGAAARRRAGRADRPAARPARAGRALGARAAPSSMASGSPSSRRHSSATSATRRAIGAARRGSTRRRALDEQPHRRVGPVRADRHGQRRQARTASWSRASRSRLVTSKVEPRRVGEQPLHELGERVEHVLGVVEHSSPCAGGERRAQRVRPGPRRERSPRRSRPRPPRRAAAAVTGTRSTHHTRATLPRRPRCASSSARRVLPTPPGPMSVTSGGVSRRARAVLAPDSSSSRPTSGDGGRGSRSPGRGRIGRVRGGSSSRSSRACRSRRSGGRVEAELLAQDPGAPVGLERVRGPPRGGQPPHQHSTGRSPAGAPQRGRSRGERLRRRTRARSSASARSSRAATRSSSSRVAAGASEPVGELAERRARATARAPRRAGDRLRGVGVHRRRRGAAPLPRTGPRRPRSPQVQQVAGRAGDDAAAGRAERPPQPRHGQCTAFSTDSGWASPQTASARRCTGTTAPGSQQQRGEQGAGPRAAGQRPRRRRSTSSGPSTLNSTATSSPTAAPGAPDAGTARTVSETSPDGQRPRRPFSHRHRASPRATRTTT